MEKKDRNEWTKKFRELGKKKGSRLKTEKREERRPNAERRQMKDEKRTNNEKEETRLKTKQTRRTNNEQRTTNNNHNG